MLQTCLIQTETQTVLLTCASVLFLFDKHEKAADKGGHFRLPLQPYITVKNILKHYKLTEDIIFIFVHN